MLIPSKEYIMDTKRLGNIGEAYALAKLVEMSIPVYQQFGDNEPADYIILVDNIPLKAQVKTSETYDGDKTIFDLTSSTAHRKNGVKHKYSKEEVDLFLCYDAKTKELFVIENTGDMSTITIRYIKPKNNQTKGINFHTDYTLCVETLYGISLNKDKEKVQTTM